MPLLNDRFKTSPLKWDALVEVYELYQENIKPKVVERFAQMFGVDVPTAYERLIGLAEIAVTYVVIRYAYDRVAKSGGRSEPASHVLGDGKVMIQNIAQIVNQSAEAVERAVPPSRRKALIPKVGRISFLQPKAALGRGSSLIAGRRSLPRFSASFQATHNSPAWITA